MPNYDYSCDVCGHKYNEVRETTDPQWYTECPVDGCDGELKEVK
jgi:putative FmdB family regulatory protein